MMKKWLPIVLLTVLALVLIGIKTYPFLKSHFLTEETNQAQGKKSEEDSLTFDEKNIEGLKKLLSRSKMKRKRNWLKPIPINLALFRKCIILGILLIMLKVNMK